LRVCLRERESLTPNMSSGSLVREVREQCQVACRRRARQDGSDAGSTLLPCLRKLQGRGFPCTSLFTRNNSIVFKDFNLKTRASMWPCLSDVCHVRWTAAFENFKDEVRPAPPASERRENNPERFQDSFLNAKARIWP
jgi:hypothetical protein